MISSYKNDNFGTISPMYNMVWPLLILHFNLVANCEERNNYYQ